MKLIVSNIKTGIVCDDATFTDHGDILEANKLTHTLEVDGIKYTSTVPISYSAEARYNADIANFKKHGFSILFE